MKNILLLLLAMAGSSMGQIIAGFGYADAEIDLPSGIDDITLGVFYASLGTEIYTQSDDFRFVPELRVGSGTKDYSASVPVVVEGEAGVLEGLGIEYFVSLSLRAEVHQNDTTDFFLPAGAYAFVNPTFTVISLEASGSLNGVEGSLTTTTEKFGVGVGLGYNFTEIASAEVYLEFYEDVTVYGVGAKFRF